MVPENELKWGTLRPGPDVFNFAPADWLLHYAQTNKIHMRGHTLVWHESFPAWLKTSLTPQNAEAELARHIGTVMGHYKGRLHSWDVVNEVLKPEDNVQGGWRKSPWLANIGPDYVELAFRLAAKSDPDVLLVWNENSIEEGVGIACKKTAGIAGSSQPVTRKRRACRRSRHSVASYKRARTRGRERVAKFSGRRE